MIERGRILSAWRVAVEVTAPAYAVAPEAIMAPSRGRGPKPPAAVCEAKKIAIYLTVILVDGLQYAALAGALGLHKDTVSSHCAWARAADHLEEKIAAFELAGRARIRAMADAPAIRLAGDRALAARNALHAYAEELARAIAADLDAGSSVSSDAIQFSRKRERRAA
jgi:hypothetical protein